MIVRIFEVTIEPALRDEFERDFATISVDAVQHAEGALSCTIGTPSKWKPDDYAMISTWRDEEALVAFAGTDWNRAVIPSGMERYAKKYQVAHYEIPEL
jgi:heme oxygenase (mycobilin-producing)